MKKLIILSIVCLALSCQKDNFVLGPTTVFNLNFNAAFDGQPLVMNQAYQFPDGKGVQFSQFDFFVSNIVLLEDDSDNEVDLSQIEFADFSDIQSGTDVHPVTFTASKVPSGTYRGIRFGIGVPSDLNKSSTNSYGAGHPLKANYDTHFWKAANSFIFLNTKGIYDVDGNGDFSALDNAFEHGVAKNSNYVTLVFNKPLVLEDGKPFDLDVVMDVMRLYADGTLVFDFSDPANLTTSNPDDLRVANFIRDNVQKAVTIE